MQRWTRRFRLELLQPLFGLSLGLALLLRARWIERQIDAEHAKRRAELDAGEAEAFFEEKRSLQAYPPLSAKGWRVSGAVLILLSVAMIMLALPDRGG